MKLHLNVNIEKEIGLVGYTDKLMTLGSCFSTEIGEKLKESRFNMEVNPFGVQFSPEALHNCINAAISDMIIEEHLVQSNQMYYSYDFHSDITATTEKELTKELKNRLHNLNLFLKNGDTLIITFGTAWAYKLKTSGKFIGNCHKMPSELFDKELLDIDAQFIKWKKLVDVLHAFNPKLKVMFTVSPVRHSKDGLHQNNISKGLLHLLVSKLMTVDDKIRYFPAYEIVMDELRDYRFYKEDLVHPNQQAVQYVYDKFSESYFTDQTKDLAALQLKIVKAERHVHLNATAEQQIKHQQHIDALKLKFKNGLK